MNKRSTKTNVYLLISTMCVSLIGVVACAPKGKNPVLDYSGTIEDHLDSSLILAPRKHSNKVALKELNTSFSFNAPKTRIKTQKRNQALQRAGFDDGGLTSIGKYLGNGLYFDCLDGYAEDNSLKVVLSMYGKDGFIKNYCIPGYEIEEMNSGIYRVLREKKLCPNLHNSTVSTNIPLDNPESTAVFFYYDYLKFDKETNELVPLCTSVVTDQEEDPDPYEETPFEFGTIIDMDARFITASYFQDGYATVSTLDENTGRANFGIVDTNGNYTVEPSYFDLSDEHHNGVVIAIQRNGIQDGLNSNSMNAPLHERDYFLQGPGSSSGFAFNRTQGFGNYGLVTVNGDVLLDMNNEYVQRIYEDTYFVRKNGKEKYLFNAKTKTRTDIESNVDYAYFAKDYALKRVKDQLYFTNLNDEIECEAGLNSYLDYFFFFWLDMKLPFTSLFSGYQDFISDFIRTGEYLKPCYVADNYLGHFIDRASGKELPIPEGLVPKTDSETYDFIDSLVPAHYKGESVIYNIDDSSYVYVDVNKKGYENVFLAVPDKWNSYGVVGDFLEFNGCYFNKNGNVVYTKGDEGITDLFKPKRNQTFSYDESVLELIKEGDDPRDVYYYLDEHLLPHYVQIDEIGKNSSKMLVSYATKEAYVTEYNGTTPLYFPLEQNTPFFFYFSEIDTAPIQVIYEGDSLKLDEDFKVTKLDGAQKLSVTTEFFDKYGLSTGTENEMDPYNRYKAPVFEITLEVICGSESTQVKIVRK